MMQFQMTATPNKSPEPTPIVAGRSAVAGNVADTAVAQLFSLGVATRFHP